MSSTIFLRIYQTNPGRGFFRIVEQTVWTKATWSDDRVTPTLTLNESGTSGVLRFLSDKGEGFTVAVGLDAQRWCDVVGRLKSGDSARVINSQYYDGERDFVREEQQTQHTDTGSLGTKLTVVYTVTEGSQLEANIIFA